MGNGNHLTALSSAGSQWWGLGQGKTCFPSLCWAISGFPMVCHHAAPQTFVFLAQDGEGRKFSGCGSCLIPSQAIFAGVFNTRKWMGPAVVRAIEMLSVNQFSQLFPVFQLSSSPSLVLCGSLGAFFQSFSATWHPTLPPLCSSQPGMGKKCNILWFADVGQGSCDLWASPLHFFLPVQVCLSMTSSVPGLNAA